MFGDVSCSVLRPNRRLVASSVWSTTGIKALLNLNKNFRLELVKIKVKYLPSWSKSILCAQSVIIENFSGLLGKSFADQMVVNIQTGQISSIPRQYGVFIFPRALVVLKMVKYLLCLTYLRSSFGKSYLLSICGLYLHELHSLLFDLRQQTCFWLSKA
jgi:hypothetical protein